MIPNSIIKPSEETTEIESQETSSTPSSLFLDADQNTTIEEQLNYLLDKYNVSTDNGEQREQLVRRILNTYGVRHITVGDQVLLISKNNKNNSIYLYFDYFTPIEKTIGYILSLQNNTIKYLRTWVTRNVNRK